MKLILQTAQGGHIHEWQHDGESPEVVTFGPATFAYHCTLREGAIYREASCVVVPSPLAMMRARRT